MPDVEEPEFTTCLFDSGDADLESEFTTCLWLVWRLACCWLILKSGWCC